MAEHAKRQSPAPVVSARRDSAFTPRAPAPTLAYARTLQRTIGNRGVQRLARQGLLTPGVWATPRRGVLQAKLSVSHPGDAAELEAERVAEQIVATPYTSERPIARAVAASAGVSRRSAHGNDAASESTSKQDAEVASPSEVGTESAPRLDTSGGSALAEPTRAFMESRFEIGR